MVDGQSNLFTGWQNLEAPGAQLNYWPDWLDISRQKDLWQSLQSLNWQQSIIRIAGRSMQIPRLNAWYGDTGRRYGYSGTRLTFNPWTEELKSLCFEVEQATGHRYNAVLANYYRDGNDSVDWHSDNEAELGKNPTIATLSLGGVRQFMMKHKHNGSADKINIDLEPGSLFLMSGETQSNWQHKVPKTKKPVEARISLTFRRVFDD